KAFAQLIQNETDDIPFFAPINEISFFSWAGAEEAKLNPYLRRRGGELKRQLVRAAIEGMEAIWEVLPHARFLQIDPIVHIVSNPKKPRDAPIAESYRLSQYQAWDMLAGWLCPEL